MPEGRFSGRVALVTGAGGAGMGSAICRRLASEGDDLATHHGRRTEIIVNKEAGRGDRQTHDDDPPQEQAIDDMGIRVSDDVMPVRVDGLHHVLKVTHHERLTTGELTYSRYQSTAQQVYLAVVSNLREVGIAGIVYRRWPSRPE